MMRVTVWSLLLAAHAAWLPHDEGNMRVAVDEQGRPSSLVEVGSKQKQKVGGVEDITQGVLELLKDIDLADAAQKVATKELGGMAANSVQKLLAHKQDADAQSEDVASEAKSTAEALSQVVSALNDAAMGVSALTDDAKKKSAEQLGWRDLAQNLQANTGISTQAAGFQKIQQMKGTFAVAYLDAAAQVKSAEEEVNNAKTKAELASKQFTEKMQNKVDIYADKTSDWTQDLNDANNEIKGPLKDLGDAQKNGARDTDKEVATMFKKIKAEINTDSPIDVKGVEKNIKDAAKETDDAAEDLVSQTQTDLEKIRKDAVDFGKQFEKKTAQDLKTVVSVAVKEADQRAKQTKVGAAEAVELSKDANGFIDEVDLANTKVADWVTSKANLFTQKETEYASQQQEIFTAAAAQGDKVVAEVHNDIDAAEAKLLSGNSATNAMTAEELYKGVQTVEDLAQETNMNIAASLGEVSSKVQRARSYVASAGSQSAEMDADLEAKEMQISGLSKSVDQVGTKAINEMQGALNSLNMEKDIQTQAFGTHAKGTIDSFSTSLSGAKDKLTSPIKRATSLASRELQNLAAQMKIDDDEKFNGLQQSYVQTVDQLRANGIDVTPGGAVPTSDVGEMIGKASKNLVALTAEKDMLANQIKNLPITTMQKTKMQTRQIEETARDNVQEIENSERTMMRNIEQQAYDKMSIMGKKLEQEKGRSIAQDESNGQQVEYVASLIDTQGIAIDKFSGEHAEALAKVKGKLAEVVNEQLPSFATTAAAAAAETQEKAEGALTRGEGMFAEILKEKGEELNKKAKLMGVKTIADIKTRQAEIEHVFTASEAAERERIMAVEKAGENMKGRTDDVTKKLERKVVEVEEIAAAAQQNAQMIGAANQQRRSRMDQDVDALEVQTKRQVEDRLAHVKRTSEEETNKAAKALHEDVDALDESAKVIVSGAGNQIAKVSGSYETLSKDVSAEEDAVRAKSEYLNEAMKDEVGGVEESIARDDEALHDSDEEVDQELHGQDIKFAGSSARNTQLLNLMEQTSEETTKQAKEKMVSEEANMDSETKAFQGELGATFKTAEMTTNSAEQQIEESKIQMDRSRDELVVEMKGVNDELNRKATETQANINTFKKFVLTESDMLNKNTAYLTAYKLTTQSGIYDLLQQVEGSIEKAAEGAQSKFKQVDEREKVIKDEMSGLMEGTGYSTLKQIMDADHYVQQATIENADVLSYVNEFKNEQMTYISTLVKTLEDSKFALILHEQEVKMEQDSIDADTAALTGNVIGSISALVRGDGGGDESAELEKMTGGTLEALLAKAQTGSAQDKAQLAFLMQQIQEHGMGKLAHLKNSQALIAAITAAVGGNQSFDMMKADLQRVVQFNQKLVDQERKRMEDRGIKLQDNLFFGNAGIERMTAPDGFDHVPLYKQNEYKLQARQAVQESYTRDAFLERQRKYVEESTAAARQALLNMKGKTPEETRKITEMSVLLKQNKDLMAENQHLQAEHNEIGHEIQDVKGQLGSENVVKPSN